MPLLEKYAFRGCQQNRLPDGTIAVFGPCVITNKIYSVTVSPSDLERFKAGSTAAQCFPYLQAGDREFLISGISDAGWRLIFPDDDNSSGG